MTIQIRRMRFTLHAAYLRLQTHSEYVTRIASPRQKCLRERASMLRHTYTDRLVKDEVFHCQHTPVARG